MTRDSMMNARRISVNAKDIKGNDYDIPGPDEAAMLAKVSPTTFIPMALANGMLVMGSHKSKEDCYFGLADLLIWTGSISIGIFIFGVVGKYIVKWIRRENKPIAQGEKIIMTALRWIRYFIILSQVGLLIGGSLYVYPHVFEWQSVHKKDPFYCDFGMMTFALSVLSICWIFVILAIVIFGVKLVQHLGQSKLFSFSSS